MLGATVPFLSLITDISISAGLDIYLADADYPETIQVDIVDKPLAEALRIILRGRSYALVYSNRSRSRSILLGQQFASAPGRHASVPALRQAPETAHRPSRPAASSPHATVQGDAAAGLHSHENAEADERSDSTVRERYLESRIQMLQDQIESGYADQWYSNRIATGSTRVVDPLQDRLEMLTEQLEQLRSR